ncbi:uncharacterized protein K441DRAFT_677289 [Cenococcum geophilum 1.58]|uniref:uncharacterized protein n=1 Tax=Cenococcum geophilum 1.58 TaxID=794803 RepID=UPI00359022B4|nr:hypothetical protein K441DRAFT_677289 [Cenococcum geophilum 1.58]
MVFGLVWAYGGRPDFASRGSGYLDRRMTDVVRAGRSAPKARSPGSENAIRDKWKEKVFSSKGKKLSFATEVTGREPNNFKLALRTAAGLLSLGLISSQISAALDATPVSLTASEGTLLATAFSTRAPAKHSTSSPTTPSQPTVSHPTAATPYRGTGPVFVYAHNCGLSDGDALPERQLRRLLSVRAYDEKHMTVSAEVVEGSELGGGSWGMLRVITERELRSIGVEGASKKSN